MGWCCCGVVLRAGVGLRCARNDTTSAVQAAQQLAGARRLILDRRPELVAPATGEHDVRWPEMATTERLRLYVIAGGVSRPVSRPVPVRQAAHTAVEAVASMPKPHVALDLHDQSVAG